jgi:Leucine-rich repeat (LRR) protein
MALKDTTFAESLNCWGEDSNLTLLSLSFNKERDVCASRQGEVNPVWMLRFAQHDRMRMANLTLLSLSFNKERDVCASRQGEVNPVWMLRFAQHDRMRMANLTLLSLSFNKERDVSATPKQGEVKQYGQKHKGQIMNLPLLLTLHL